MVIVVQMLTVLAGERRITAQKMSSGRPDAECLG